MKFVIAIFSLVLSTASLAADYALMIPQGAYAYAGLQTFSVKRYEVVRASDKDRLQILRAQKYDCLAQAGQTYQCSKFDKGAEVPEQLRKKISDEFRSYVVNFQEVVGGPRLENEGEILQEFSVSQRVSAGSNNYKNYKYQIVQGTHKITPLSDGGVMQDFTWVVDSETQLREPRSYELREAMNKWSRYSVALILQK